MTSINLPGEAFEALVQKAILDSLTPEQRENIIAQALKFLVTPQESGYYGKRVESPLQHAFQTATRGALGRVVEDMVVNDEEVRGFVEGELRTLVREFTRQLGGDTYSELRSVLIDAMVQHLADKRARGDA